METIRTTKLQISKLCRICMDLKSDMLSIFETSQINKEVAVSALIMSCAKVQISPDDSLPTKICQECCAKLYGYMEFVSLCQSSDQLLRKLLLDEIIEEEDIPNPYQVMVDEDGISIKAELESVEGDNVAAMNSGHLDEETADVVLEPVCDLEISTKRTRRTTTPFDAFLGHDRPQLPRRNMYNNTKNVRWKPLKTYICDVCQKKCKDRTHLKRHSLRDHNVRLPPVDFNKCQVCDLKFPNWTEFQKHCAETRHMTKEICTICNKELTKSYISHHMRTHSGDLSFLCTTCGRRFVYEKELSKHTKRCLNIEKQFKCSFCDTKFHEKNRLKSHEKNHLAKKRFICEECGKPFLTKYKLSLHQMIHSNMKPYSCSTCAATFRQPTHLKEHLRIHTGDRPFACNLCAAAFTQGHCLKTHKLKKHSKTVKL